MSAFANFFDEIAAGIVAPRAEEAARAERAARYARLGLREVDAPFPLPTATLVGDISPAIARTITSFFARRPAWGVGWDDNPPVVLCKAPVGSGKSQHLADYLPHLVYWDKHVAKRPHRIIVLAPTLELAHQLAGRYRRAITQLLINGRIKERVTVAVFEGRGDPFDEEEPPRRDYPCADLASVKLAIQAGDTVQSAVCGKKDSEPQCPHRGNCKYYRQMGAAADADILFIAHRGDHNQLFRLPMNGGEAKPFDIKVQSVIDASRCASTGDGEGKNSAKERADRP